jgi:hypothetical protein
VDRSRRNSRDRRRIAGYAAIFLTAKPQDLPPASAREPVWTEAAWPFPIDQWGQGWAYQCKAADCGVEINLYLRPKIGFCNCQTGVADDAELDRVSDLDLVGSKRSAPAPGHPITVHWMKGRSCGYKVVGSAKPALEQLAFNDKCDRIVATVIAGNEPVVQEQAVLKFLINICLRVKLPRRMSLAWPACNVEAKSPARAQDMRLSRRTLVQMAAASAPLLPRLVLDTPRGPCGSCSGSLRAALSIS